MSGQPEQDHDKGCEATVHRRTKIVATLGPACREPRVLDGLVGAGMDVARINLSHGSRSEHEDGIAAVRAAVRGGARRLRS